MFQVGNPAAMATLYPNEKELVKPPPAATNENLYWSVFNSVKVIVPAIPPVLVNPLKILSPQVYELESTVESANDRVSPGDAHAAIMAPKADSAPNPMNKTAIVA